MPPIDLDPRFVCVDRPSLVELEGILICQVQPDRRVSIVKWRQKS